MNQRLCIGIHKLTSEWKILLNELGVWFEEVDYSHSLPENYSAIILNTSPDSAQLSKLKVYLKGNGAVLEMKGLHIFGNKDRVNSKSVKTLINESEYKAFCHIPFVDVFSEIETHQDSDILEGLIHFPSKNEYGNIAFFGADIPELIQKSGYTRKRFFNQNGKYPNEIVSKISKHELTEAFCCTLAHLHYQRNLPFIQKWSSPDEKPVFCFRVDSDFGDKESIKHLYKVIKNRQVKATWFLHVEAHQQWLDLFHGFQNQEIALHGYKHGTATSTEKIHANIRRGKQLLESNGLNIKGFCAPYGIWNEGLKDALSEFNFDYTSEFTFKYDGYPAYPAHKNSSLQIPVHPICTGSLSRLKYTESKMRDYFELVLKNKIARFEPIIFYHHPLQPGLNVIDHIFKIIKQSGFKNLTFAEYADFWHSRLNFSFEARYNEDQLFINTDSEQECILQVSFDHDSFNLVKPADRAIDLTNTPKFEYSNSYLPDAKETKIMRKTDLRFIKTSLVDWKNRIRL